MAVVKDYVDAELKKRNIAGPWSCEQCSQVITNHIGVIPKSGQPGKRHFIVDLSFPEGNSVNSGIDKLLLSMTYSSVVDVAHLLLELGQGVFMAKIDVASAYRIQRGWRFDCPKINCTNWWISAYMEWEEIMC